MMTQASDIDIQYNDTPESSSPELQPSENDEEKESDELPSVQEPPVKRRLMMQQQIMKAAIDQTKCSVKIKRQGEPMLRHFFWTK